MSDSQPIIDTATIAAAPHSLTADLATIVTPEGAELHQIDLEQYLTAPRRARGTVGLDTADSLARFVTARTEGQQPPAIYADWRTATVAAILNDDDSTRGPGWRDWRAVLTLRKTPEWARWESKDGTLGSQVSFAEQIEQGLDDIADPPGADLLELAQHFQAVRNVNFRSSKRLSNGETQLVYEETLDAKAGQRGDMNVPAEFLLSVAPYEGTEPVAVAARLRFRLDSGALRIGYQLDRPDKVLRDAFTAELGKVEAAVGITAYLGRPPSTP